MLREAEQILGYDLLKLCTEGPKEKLDDTTYAQVGNYHSLFARVSPLHLNFRNHQSATRGSVARLSPKRF